MEQQIIAGLVARGIPEHIAKGMVANMIAESNLNPGINEIAPLVPGSRGGYGLNQWTGPRRRQFEAYVAERGVSPDNLDAQLDFTLWELQNTEKGAWNALSGAPDAVTAARIYSDKFLRPGIPYMDKRLSEAARLAGVAAPQGGYTAQGSPPPMQAGQPTQNALAPFQPQKMQLDPADFMNAPNRLAMQPIELQRFNQLARFA
jgi:hypothetical protein